MEHAETSKAFALRLDDIPDPLTADVLITSTSLLPLVAPDQGSEGTSDSTPSSAEVHGIVIVDGPITSLKSSPSESSEVKGAAAVAGNSRSLDAALLIIPPGNEGSGEAQGPINVLINGEGTQSCPSGKSKLYHGCSCIAWFSVHLNVQRYHVLQYTYISARRAKQGSPRAIAPALHR